MGVGSRGLVYPKGGSPAAARAFAAAQRITSGRIARSDRGDPDQWLLGTAVAPFARNAPTVWEPRRRVATNWGPRRACQDSRAVLPTRRAWSLRRVRGTLCGDRVRRGGVHLRPGVGVTIRPADL